MKILSLFANIGVAEAYLEELGFEVIIANELIERRASLYSALYPNTKMICGDITSDLIYRRILEESNNRHVDVVLATPPCQGASRARQGIKHEKDIRNKLMMSAVHMIRDVNPRYAFIENVPQMSETTIEIGDKRMLVPEYIDSVLAKDYYISMNIIDTKNYSVPQTRQRLIILLSRKDQNKMWTIPAYDEKIITLEDAIGDLPSLDPHVRDLSEEERKQLFPEYEEKKKAGLKVSPWHFPPDHVKRQVIVMMHTPTGCTAFNNKKYIPLKKNGEPVSGYLSTYRRLRWCDPACTVTMDNRKISSQNNVHPGRYLGKDENGDVLYSDPRALTLFELMRVMSIPDDWPLPRNVNTAFVRSVIGEGIPPLFVKKVFENLK